MKAALYLLAPLGCLVVACGDPAIEPPLQESPAVKEWAEIKALGWNTDTLSGSSIRFRKYSKPSKRWVLEERTIQLFEGRLILSVNEWGVLSCATPGNVIEKWKNPETGRLAGFLLYSSFHKNVKVRSWRDVLVQTNIRSTLQNVPSKNEKRKDVYDPLVYYSIALNVQDSATLEASSFLGEEGELNLLYDRLFELSESFL